AQFGEVEGVRARAAPRGAPLRGEWQVVRAGAGQELLAVPHHRLGEVERDRPRPERRCGQQEAARSPWFLPEEVARGGQQKGGDRRRCVRRVERADGTTGTGRAG